MINKLVKIELQSLDFQGAKLCLICKLISLISSIKISLDLRILAFPLHKYCITDNVHSLLEAWSFGFIQNFQVNNHIYKDIGLFFKNISIDADFYFQFERSSVCRAHHQYHRQSSSLLLFLSANIRGVKNKKRTLLWENCFP